MCLCILALPFSICYFQAGCDHLCCRCVNENCLINFNMGVEECADCCCCVPESVRVRLCDVCAWYQFCCCVHFPVEPEPAKNAPESAEPANKAPESAEAASDLPVQTRMYL